MDEIMIYGAVGDWWEGLDAATLVPMIASGKGDLTLAINSPGGLVMEGLAIFNAVARAVQDGRKVTCRIDGLAASMASVLALAGSEVIMADNALMMIHNPWDCACGDAQDLRKAADQLDTLKNTIVNIYAKRTGMGADEISALMDAETWMTAQDALARGFIDTIGTSSTASGRISASNITKFGFRKAPDHPLIAKGAMAISTRTAPPVGNNGKSRMDKTETGATGSTANTQQTTNHGQQNSTSGANALAANEAAAAADRAVAAERQRAGEIRMLGNRHNIDASAIDKMIADGTSIEDARNQILDTLAKRTDSQNVGGPIQITADERDKFLQGATNWLLIRGGVASMVQKAAKMRGETIKLDAGEFRGASMVDIARETLVRSRMQVMSRDPGEIVGSAFTAKAVIGQGPGDFPILLENVMHKTLQASYVITADTWSRFCGKGSVTDFRPSNRYLRGTFGALDPLTDLGEFKQKAIPDGEKQTITAATKGNIISLSRQMIINDDMGAFISVATDLGRAAKLTIEKDVYALLAANPVMYDGNALFSAAHRNIAGTGGFASQPAVGTPSVVNFDAARVCMALQMDPSNNEILDITPDVFLGPKSMEGAVKVIIGAPYDPDTPNKLQRPNMVQSLVQDVVGTGRLSGTGWYFFADKELAPAIEVAFLNGVEEPFLDNELGWRIDGTEYKVRLDYGAGAVNWRSAFFNPGQ